jgi:hypothetical protein
MGHGKAEQCIARFRQDLLGIAKITNVLLSRQRQQHSAQQQSDDEQHDGEFDQREAALDGYCRMFFRLKECFHCGARVLQCRGVGTGHSSF